MPLRSSLTHRLAIATAVGTLAVAAMATPAVADDDWNGQGGQTSGNDGNWSQNGGDQGDNNWDQNGNANSNSNSNSNANPNPNPNGNGNGNGNANPNGNGNGTSANASNSQNQRLYRGRVTASTLALRARPDRGGQVIRYAHRGEIVSIFCKTGGQNVDGNPLWYLLTDGTWAWGAARYIDNIGAAPRWC
ncbi:hypothetical protein ADK57_41580 [Streptomyces sp. MMG1533]|uniref:SH3 domain-containing protein n=1 Tax=Streptomyces sp. MMG1533 TaxID=1415546 RepID=UPI0006AF2C96|nr:SH3 domain-containing protein [Streptomyces sp. MMG1533]KOU56661.1 hypothetical protein ADK57_41580 [Streptomyces sp. MMG1533]